MAAYGDYDTVCPEQTFTPEEKAAKAPDSPSAPWQVINTWKTEPMGIEGFSAVIPGELSARAEAQLCGATDERGSTFRNGQDCRRFQGFVRMGTTVSVCMSDNFNLGRAGKSLGKQKTARGVAKV